MDKVINLISNKFKNNALSVTIPLNLNDKTTEYNLISLILKRGCGKYPSTKELWEHLQQMYGAVFDIVITKKGEKLFLNFYIVFINNKYVLYKEDLVEEGIKLLSEFIYHPLIEKEQFKEEYFNQEKENLRVLINSRIDNKDEYAIEKCCEISCTGEPYSIYKYGDIERLSKISNKELIDIWNRIVKNKEFYFLCSGNVEDETLNRLIEKYFGEVKSSNEKPTILESKRNEVKEVIEHMKINQGKLAMCFKGESSILNGDYFALIVMSSILGGGTHSKLFNEVREKNSLAYYCYSFVEKFKGLLIVTAGVDSEKYKMAKDIILLQVDKMKNGEVSELELNSAKSKLINDFKAIEDSQYSIIDYIGALRAYGIDYHVKDIINEIDKVTFDRVIEEAKKINLDTIYFLDKEE